jgi:hypothetical protein
VLFFHLFDIFYLFMILIDFLNDWFCFRTDKIDLLLVVVILALSDELVVQLENISNSIDLPKRRLCAHRGSYSFLRKYKATVISIPELGLS